MSAIIMATIGICLAIVIPGISAGIALSSTGNAMSGALSERPEVFAKVVISVVFAEAIAIYGLLISILILNAISNIQATLALQYSASFIGANDPALVAQYIQEVAWNQGNIALFAGVTIGGVTLAAGVAIAITGASVTSVVAEKPELFTKGVISVVFSEALAIYGLLIAILLLNQIVVPTVSPIFPT
ncbi:MAG: hypothetical protein ACW976_00215 [Candidatus Ranarchaeia archaeon]|jgi:V-type H+-transporting ATPase proteolipid subunit